MISYNIIIIVLHSSGLLLWGPFTIIVVAVTTTLRVDFVKNPGETTPETAPVNTETLSPVLLMMKSRWSEIL